MRKTLTVAAAALVALTSPANAGGTLPMNDENTWAAICTQWTDATLAGNRELESINRRTLDAALNEVHRYYGIGARQGFLAVCQAVADNPTGYWAQRGRLAIQAHNERMALAAK